MYYFLNFFIQKWLVSGTINCIFFIKSIWKVKVLFISVRSPSSQSCVPREVILTGLWCAWTCPTIACHVSQPIWEFLSLHMGVISACAVKDVFVLLLSSMSVFFSNLPLILFSAPIKQGERVYVNLAKQPALKKHTLCNWVWKHTYTHTVNQLHLGATKWNHKNHKPSFRKYN